MIEALPLAASHESLGAFLNSPAQRKITEVQEKLAKLPQVEMPLTHEFTPGLYVRTINMPKGVFVISKIHKTEHPYFITKGKVSVWIEGHGWKLFVAPHQGITMPGTRRLLYIHEDCQWTTIHATDKRDVAQIERDVIFNPEKEIEV